MDVRDLRYFYVAAECGHLGQAAERLQLTQPAITKSIRRLETEIDGKLFLLDGRRLQLTAAGRLLLERARAIDLSLQQTLKDVRREAKGHSGRVRVGASLLVAETLFPRISTLIRNEAPGLTLELVIKGSEQLCAEVTHGDLDMAVIPLHGALSPDIQVTHLLEDSLVVVCAAGHPLLEKTQVSIADLSEYDWVLPHQKSFVRQQLNDIFHRYGLPAPFCRIEVESVLAAPGLVWTSDLLGFTSRLSLHGSRFTEKLQEIPGCDVQASRQIALIARKLTYEDPIKRNAARLISRESNFIFHF